MAGARVVNRGGAGVPTVGLGVAGLRGGCLGGRCEALGELPGRGGGGGRFTGVAFSSHGELALGAAGTTTAGSASPFAMLLSACLLPLGMKEEGHFGAEEERESLSFPPLKNITSSSSSSSAETDCCDLARRGSLLDAAAGDATSFFPTVWVPALPGTLVRA